MGKDVRTNAAKLVAAEKVNDTTVVQEVSDDIEVRRGKQSHHTYAMTCASPPYLCDTP